MAIDQRLNRQEEKLLRAFVSAWEASGHTPFDFGEFPLEHPDWPPAVTVPNREDVRQLVHLGMLEVDKRVAPTWRVFPSGQARQMFGMGQSERDALSDPDTRLGLILDASIEAFEADPSEPLRLHRMQHLDFVEHPHWQLQPDALREHDLDQLQELSLLSTRRREGLIEFWPTTTARRALRDVPAYLEQAAGETDDEAESSRLRHWAERLRAGDVAVGTAAGSFSGALIRALMGG